MEEEKTSDWMRFETSSPIDNKRFEDEKKRFGEMFGMGLDKSRTLRIGPSEQELIFDANDRRNFEHGQYLEGALGTRFKEAIKRPPEMVITDNEIENFAKAAKAASAVRIGDDYYNPVKLKKLSLIRCKTFGGSKSSSFSSLFPSITTQEPPFFCL